MQGDNFAIGIAVEIGGVRVPPADVELHDVHHLLVQRTPAFADEGPRSIAVITAAGHRHELDNVLIYSESYDGNDGGAIERALADAEIDAEEQALADAERAAEAERAAAERAARESGTAELLIASVNPTLCPLAGAAITLHLENAPVDGLTVTIAGRKVYHSAKRKGALDVELECQAPRLDSEGFQPIRVTAPDGREASVDNVLLYADVQVPPPKAKAAAASSNGAAASSNGSHARATSEQPPVSDTLLDIDQLNEMDAMLDNLEI